MDKEKIEKAVELLQASGSKAYLLLTLGEESHGIHIDGTFFDLAKLIANVLEEENIDNLFAFAIKIHLAQGRRYKNAEQE